MDPQDLPQNQELSVTVYVGNFSAPAGRIRIVGALNILIVVIPILVVFFLINGSVIFLLLCVVFSKKNKQKTPERNVELQNIHSMEGEKKV